MARGGVDNIRDRLMSPALDEWFDRARENLSVLPIGELQSAITRKGERIQELLSPEVLREAGESELTELLETMATVRPKGTELLAATTAQGLREALSELVTDKGPADVRVTNFVSKVSGVPEGLSRDLAAEVLHFTEPERHPLWTRWVWDPRVGTGALPYALEFTIDKQVGLGPFYSIGVLYKDVADSLEQVRQVLAERDWGVTGEHSVEVFMSYMYADYLHKMFFTTLSKSVSGVFPTVLGVMHWIHGLPIPPEAKFKGLTDPVAS